jgi:hypothetical protein
LLSKVVVVVVVAVVLEEATITVVEEMLLVWRIEVVDVPFVAKRIAAVRSDWMALLLV